MMRISLSGTGYTSGFTLVEMLVSLAIFALIGVSAYQVLASSALVSEREEERTDKMRELDRALRIIERDLRQLVGRPVRDELGPRPALHSNLDRPLEFTRAGNENPLGLERSNLLRVGYELSEPETAADAEQTQRRAETEDTLQLKRLVWRAPDSSLETPYSEQLLLSAVTGLSLAFMDDESNWHDAWPVPADGRQGGNENTDADAADVPAAIELFLSVAGIGELNRVINLR